MLNSLFSRNELYWGKKAQEILASKNVAVFGLGGVGGFCVEALARAGVKNLTIADFDTVSLSNINRQIIALHSTIGKKKTELFAKRLKDINPDINLNIIDDFYQDETELLIDGKFNFVADAIDTMRSKINLITACYQNEIPIISSMGAGNRIDPTQLYITDLKDIQNRNYPFVSNVIYQLKKREITQGIKFVCSREKPYSEEKIAQHEEIMTKNGDKIEFNKITPSSTPFVASCSGILMAYYIVKELINDKG